MLPCSVWCQPPLLVFNPLFCSGRTNYISVDMYPKQYTTCSCSTTSYFDKFLTKIQNWTFGRTTFISHKRSIRCVGLAICILSMLNRPNLEVTRTTVDSVSGGIMLILVPPIVACSFCSSVGTSRVNIFVTVVYASIASIATGPESSNSILNFMEITHGMPLSIYVVSSDTFIDRFRATSEPDSNLQVSHFYDKSDNPRNFSFLFYWRSQFWRFDTFNATFLLRFEIIHINLIWRWPDVYRTNCQMQYRF